MSRKKNASPAIVWLRDDLRVDDNPALVAASEASDEVLVVYILDETSKNIRPLGGAARLWLHHSLASLNEALEKAGGCLDLFEGSAGDIVPALAKASGAAAVHWNRRYAEAEIAVDTQIKAALKEASVEAESHNGHLMHEPWTVKPKGGGYFKVFTPFLNAEAAIGEVPRPVAAPRALHAAPYPAEALPRTSLAKLKLLPTKPDWAGGLRESWTPGETGAGAALHEFVDGALRGYADKRDEPSSRTTSRLSPHLRFGEVSIRRVYHSAADALGSREAKQHDVAKFQSELTWRDFSYNLLFDFPELPAKNFQDRFDSFPWEKPEKAALRAWQMGRTGYPIVDAGMRELWQTGFMHNRVRLIVGSFLVKHLLTDWRIGEAWFWDTLCDADLANNTANWQWVAGSGADAAPYFRIFNPILQGKKFDPDGDYVRQYVPELAKLAKRWIHEPWSAPKDQLDNADVTLGKTYPARIIEHDKARKRALEAFDKTKNGKTKS